MAEQMKKLNPVSHANTNVKARKALLETLDAAIEEDKRHPL
jgi:enoyl-CoA hydratase